MLTEKLLAFALLGAEWVLYLLALLSVLSIGMMIERWLFFRRNRFDVSAVSTRLHDLLAQDKRDEAETLLREGATIEGSVAARALAELDRGQNAVEQTLLGAMANERSRTDRFLVFLGTLGNNAPFIGLFGTVLGIIRAFNDLGLSQEGGAATVMAGISEALVATAVGLLVALPAVVAFNYFQKRAGDVAANADALMRVLLARAPATGS